MPVSGAGSPWTSPPGRSCGRAGSRIAEHPGILLGAPARIGVAVRGAELHPFRELDHRRSPAAAPPPQASRPQPPPPTARAGQRVSDAHQELLGDLLGPVALDPAAAGGPRARRSAASPAGVPAPRQRRGSSGSARSPTSPSGTPSPDGRGPGSHDGSPRPWPRGRRCPKPSCRLGGRRRWPRGSGAPAPGAGPSRGTPPARRGPSGRAAAPTPAGRGRPPQPNLERHARRPQASVGPEQRPRFLRGYLWATVRIAGGSTGAGAPPRRRRSTSRVDRLGHDYDLVRRDAVRLHDLPARVAAGGHHDVCPTHRQPLAGRLHAEQRADQPPLVLHSSAMTP